MVYNFDYTGNVQEITLTKGSYRLECWGAQGGTSYGSSSAIGSKGGYSSGILTLSDSTTLYVFVGGQGSRGSYTSLVNGGWNGGGASVGFSNYDMSDEYGYSYPACGGGATDIATVTSDMNYSNGRTNRSSESLLSRFIVAGGGAGGSYRYTNKKVTTTDWEIVFTQSANCTFDDGYGRYILNPNYIDYSFQSGEYYRMRITSGNYCYSQVTYRSDEVNNIWDAAGNPFTAEGYTYHADIRSYIEGEPITYVIEKQIYSSYTSSSEGSSNGSQQGGGVSGKGLYPGTQSSAGSGGGFGLGANMTTLNYRYCSGAGGGGWYGGGSSYSDSSTSTINYSGGGSGFVNIETNAQYRPTNYTGLLLDSGATTAGNTSHPSVNGGTEVGHSGNGYARITYIGEEYNPLNDYTQIEYIESDGNLYINTGVIPTANTSLEITLIYLNCTYNGWGCFYGSRDSSTSSYFGLFVNHENSGYNNYITNNYAGFDPGINSGIQINTDKKYTFKQDLGNFYIDGVKSSALSTTNTLSSSSVPIYLLAFGKTSNSYENRYTLAKIYSCKIYESGTIIRDYIPVIRKQDEVSGLYDKVNNIFYESQSSANFIAGPEVLPPVNPYKFRRRLLSNIVNNNELIWIPLGTNYSNNGTYYKHLLHFDIRTPIYAIARTDLALHDCEWCSWLVFISNPAEGSHDYATLSECGGYTTGKFFGCEYKTETGLCAKDYNYPTFCINNYNSAYRMGYYWDYSTNTEVKGDLQNLSNTFNPEYIPELDKTIYTYYFDSPKYFSYCQSGINITRYYILVPKNYVQTTINKWV